MNEMIDPGKLYPLKFAPIYQERIWGGNQLGPVLGRELPVHDAPIGESWELADRTGACSVVTNGPLAGKNLHELVIHYGRTLLGRNARTLDRFPLLVKLIDAGERLSLQVHPDEQLCRELADGSEPKTEMWYVVAAQPGAKILAGLQGRASRHQLAASLESGELEEFLQCYNSAPGDAYFITAGTLHAIGAGNLILEIQQNSDTTYRLSDWGRVDAQGRRRELHVEKGMRAVNFANRTSPRIAGAADRTTHNRKFEVVECPFFTVTDLRIVEPWCDAANGSSFHLLSAVNGSVAVCRGSAGSAQDPVELAPGESALLPAEFGSYVIVPCGTEPCTIVKTTL